MVGDRARSNGGVPQTDAVADRYRRAAIERERERIEATPPGSREPDAEGAEVRLGETDAVLLRDCALSDDQAGYAADAGTLSPEIAAVQADSADLRALSDAAAELAATRRKLRAELAFNEAAGERARARLRLGRWLGLSLLSFLRMRRIARAAALLERQREILQEELEAAALDIAFDIGPDSRRAFAELARQFERLRIGGAVRDLAGDPDRAAARAQWRGTESELSRTVSFPNIEIDGIYSDIEPLRLRNGSGDDFFFYPFFLFWLKPDTGLTVLDIRKVRLSAFDDSGAAKSMTAGGRDTAIRTVRPPSESDTVDRFARYNRAPPLRPARLRLTSDAGLDVIYLVRDGAVAIAVAEAFATYVASLPSRGLAFVRPERSEDGPLSVLPPVRPQIPALVGAGTWAMAAAILVVTVGAVAAWRMDGATQRNAESLWAEAQSQWADIANLSPSAAPPLETGTDAPSVGTVTNESASLAPTDEEPVESATTAPLPMPAPSGTAPVPLSTQETALEPEGTASPELATVPTSKPAVAAAAPVAAAAAASPVTVAAGGLSRTEARRLQEQLQALGFATGTPDGAIGPRTRAAVKAYQRSQGLDPTGAVDRVLYNLILTERPAPKPATVSVEPPPPEFPFVRKPLLRPSTRGR